MRCFSANLKQGRGVGNHSELAMYSLLLGTHEAGGSNSVLKYLMVNNGLASCFDGGEEESWLLCVTCTCRFYWVRMCVSRGLEFGHM